MTNKPEQLTDEELEELISELEVCGIYGRQVRGLVELQERRKLLITFYRDGIAAAAAWLDKQRESYDNEHGCVDNDTGMFEFGNDAQRDYSETLAEIAEGIRALHPNTAQPAPVSVPDDVLAAMQKVARIRLDLNDFDGDRRGIADCLGEAEEALIELVNRRAAMLQGGDGNSPVIPDGYALVPIEPTKEMIDAGWSYYMTTKSPSSIGVYGAMLAAAPQQEVK